VICNEEFSTNKRYVSHRLSGIINDKKDMENSQQNNESVL